MSDEELLMFMEEEGGDAYSVKSLVIDCADNHGSAVVTALRQLDLISGGAKIALVPADYTAISTTFFDTFYPWLAFDTTLSKTGNNTDTAWASELNALRLNNRLICVIDSARTFKDIVMNNAHSGGTATDQGVKNAKIYVTDSIYTDLTYGAAVTGGTLIFDGVFPEHAATDTVQDFLLTLIP